MSNTANAFAAGLARGKEKKVSQTEKAPEPRSGGNWSRMAMDEMERSLQETREMRDVMQKTLVDGVLNGDVPIYIPIEQIVDELGTDRILDTADDESDAGSFESLVENIKSRGLRVPLRVRPKDPSWTPSEENPRDVGGAVFILQSGRRRLAACRKLGVTPTAFISLSEGDTRFSDLQERFFENAARKNLTLVEKLYSIGLLAEGFKGMSQKDVAAALGVGQVYVSRGISVVENFDRLKADIDLATATSRDIDDLLKRYRKEEIPTQTPEAIRKRKERKAKTNVALPFKKQTVGRADISLKANAHGERILALRSKTLDDGLIERILDVIREAEDRAGES